MAGGNNRNSVQQDINPRDRKRLRQIDQMRLSKPLPIVEQKEPISPITAIELPSDTSSPPLISVMLEVEQMLEFGNAEKMQQATMFNSAGTAVVLPDTPRDSALGVSQPQALIGSSQSYQSFSSGASQDSAFTPDLPPKLHNVTQATVLPKVVPPRTTSSQRTMQGPREMPFKNSSLQITPPPALKQNEPLLTRIKKKRISIMSPRLSLSRLTSNKSQLEEIPDVQLAGYTPQQDGTGTRTSRVHQPQSPSMLRSLTRRFSRPLSGLMNYTPPPPPPSTQPHQQYRDLESGQDGNRVRSLSRPERAQKRRSQQFGGAVANGQQQQPQQNITQQKIHNPNKVQAGCATWWHNFSRIITAYVPDFFLDDCCGKNSNENRQAWREKSALVTIVVFMMVLLGFMTFGFQYIACGINQSQPRIPIQKTSDAKYVTVRGEVYDVSGANSFVKSLGGLDATWLFPKSILPNFQSVCLDIPGITAVKESSCTAENSGIKTCGSYNDFKELTTFPRVGQQSIDWSYISANSSKYIVYNGLVIQVDKYIQFGNNYLDTGDDFGQLLQNSVGQDMSYQAQQSQVFQQKMRCLAEQYTVGYVESVVIGCFASQAFTYVSLTVILGVLLARFFLAVMFLWTTGDSYGKYSPADKERMEAEADLHSQSNSPMSHQSVNGSALAPAVVAAMEAKRYDQMPVYRKSMTLPTKSRFSQQYNLQTPVSKFHQKSKTYKPSPLKASQSLTSSVIMMDYSSDGVDMSGILRTILLVTCYSESEAQLRVGLDSLARTTFPDSHKMLFLIADGLITGNGNNMSTPDTLISMLEIDQQFAYPPQPFSYVSIADGSKRHNMAQVYAGRYRVDDHVVPTILVVKCGTPEEMEERKPGNRGKRDSQILLMQFLNKVMFDERMTPLEFDMFTKMTAVSSSQYQSVPLDTIDVKITPDQYELVLMVDADTRVHADALTPMSYTMACDPKIIGICGETQVANKTDSWVTAIQVFEYYLAHFLAKSFESVFGSCTCLPGCFCMYRIKAPKGAVDPKTGNQYYVPILANPDIVEAYSENIVETLHAKNLLLLGEDRYLTTLMLKTFPKRSLVFVPAAKCETVVPDDFATLLSQRRRWINSTFHNLLELVMVRDLCGIFCFSMQFQVAMELIGSAVLPAAITFTIYLLIISFFVTPPPLIPLGLLAAILGLPAVLIVTTGRRWQNLLWMVIYLLSLPIWNFILPVYAYLHFDDFSWGETRKLQGGDAGHEDSQQPFDPSRIVMKQWAEWERERRQSNARDKLRGMKDPRTQTFLLHPKPSQQPQYR